MLQKRYKTQGEIRIDCKQKQIFLQRNSKLNRVEMKCEISEYIITYFDVALSLEENSFHS